MGDDTTLDEFGEGTGRQESITEEHPRFGSLPDNWEISEIASVAEVVGGSTPSTSNEEYWDGGIPWATPTDITALSGNTISKTEDTITDKGLESASTHLLPPKSVLMTSRATIGKCAVNTVEMATNQGFKNLVPSDEAESWYLYYRMLDTAGFLNSLGSGSTFDEVSKTEVQSVDIPIPPLLEQRKIATVLHTVDQAIQKTEEIIETLNRVEIAARKSLLTRGVGSNERSQSTPTGEYPADWEIVRAGNEVKLRNGEFLPKSERDEDGEYPVYGGNGIMGRTHDSTVEPETVIIGRVGAYCGNVHITAEEAWVTDNAIVLTDVSSDYIPRFLTALLSKIGLGQFSEQSAQPRISQSTVENLRIPKPPISEQETIVEILSSIEQNKNCNQKYQNRMEYIKQGLMQDLLSGEVRTTDVDIDIPEEVAKYG